MFLVSSKILSNFFEGKFQNDIVLLFFDIFWCDLLYKYKKCSNFTFVKKFWRARRNFCTSSYIKDSSVLKNLPTLDVFSAISGNRRIKICDNHKNRSINIRNCGFHKFLHGRAKYVSIWILKKDSFWMILINFYKDIFA